MFSFYQSGGINQGRFNNFVLPVNCSRFILFSSVSRDFIEHALHPICLVMSTRIL